MAHCRSSGGQGAARNMVVPALGRKFWTMTSCTCPWRACAAAMACSAASWSLRWSPMPTRIPVVKGMASSPASSSVARRRAGTLSGAPRCAARPSARDSSIMPWLADTGRSEARSVRVERAGVGVGEQAGLLQDEAAHGGEVVHRRGVALCRQPVPGHGVALLGLLAQGEEGLVAARGLPGLGDGQHLLGEQVGGGDAGRRLGEGAVAAAVPAQHGQGDEDLGRERDPPPVGAVADGTGQRGQVLEGRLQEIGVGEH